MDCYGDGTTYRGVTSKDSSIKTFEWRVGMNVDADAITREYIENLKVCGNCRLYKDTKCPMADFALLIFPDASETCDNWTFDRKNRAKRMVHSGRES